MTDAIVRQFRALLTGRFGWRLEEDRGALAQVLMSRLRPQQTPDLYLAALRTAPDDSPELRALAEALAVSETYFFRNPEHFAVLADLALPAIAARRPAGPIRILSAGSASGEEAYSIAVTIAQRRKVGPLPPVEILGLDISPRVIEKARRGRYTAWALRGMPAPVRDEFFELDGQHFDLRRDVAAMVRFETHNLLDLARAIDGIWDVVFFRNTFMYFTPAAAREVMASVAAIMPAEGFLFLGHAETLRGISDDFELCNTHQSFYYQRRAAGAPAVQARLPLSTQLPPAPVAAADVAPELTSDVLAVDAGAAWFHEIHQATERVAALVDGRDLPSRSRPVLPLASTARGADSPLAAEAVATALAHLVHERHHEALLALGDGPEPERLLLRAVLLANMERLDEARTACTAVLAADSLDAGAYYVQALCEERTGNLTQSARLDEMAIYLDDSFAMPHLHLALLSRRRGDRAAALRHARDARERFAGEDELRILLFGGGFGRQGLLQLCDAQLRSLAS